MAEKILMGEYKALSKERWTNIELVNDNVFEWSVALIVLNEDSPYHGSYFKARMTFPKNYPYSPPDFKFIRPIFHPNVYPDGRLCISILHAPGEDEMSGELASERWSPAQRVESVLISILSLLDDAEVSSPANVDAAVLWRKSRAAFDERARRDADASRQDVPPGFVLPTHAEAFRTVAAAEDDFHMDAWGDSEEEMEDFGGSESEFDVGDLDEEDAFDSGSLGEEEEEEDDDVGDLAEKKK